MNILLLNIGKVFAYGLVYLIFLKTFQTMASVLLSVLNKRHLGSSYYVISIIKAPFIILHETAHLITALIFFNKITDVKLLRFNNPEEAGSISFKHTYWRKSLLYFYQKAGDTFIGISPLFLGIFILGKISNYLMQATNVLFLNYIVLAIFLISVFAFSNEDLDLYKKGFFYNIFPLILLMYNQEFSNFLYFYTVEISSVLIISLAIMCIIYALIKAVNIIKSLVLYV